MGIRVTVGFEKRAHVTNCPLEFQGPGEGLEVSRAPGGRLQRVVQRRNASGFHIWFFKSFIKPSHSICLVLSGLVETL